MKTTIWDEPYCPSYLSDRTEWTAPMTPTTSHPEPCPECGAPSQIQCRTVNLEDCFFRSHQTQIDEREVEKAVARLEFAAKFQMDKGPRTDAIFTVLEALEAAQTRNEELYKMLDKERNRIAGDTKNEGYAWGFDRATEMVREFLSKPTG